MDYGCPLCNGLTVLELHCPTCCGTMRDLGKLEFLFGPYSPYREWDDLRLANGYPDLGSGLCIHIIRCDRCDYQTEHPVGEQQLPEA